VHPKKRINFLAHRMDDIHGNNKKVGGKKKVSATGWMNNIHGKNTKAKKLSCDRMDDDNIHGKNKKGEKKKSS
jgi:hypothetical protein